MKYLQKLTLLLILLCITLSCTTYRNNIGHNKEREMLKEYFLFKCISRGYPEMNFAKFDHSASIYFELSNYAPEAYSKVDSLAKDFVNKIESEGTCYENEKTKSIFLQSMEYFKNSKLDHFLKGLDEYHINYHK